MSNFIILIFIPFLIYFINIIIIKKKLLPNYSGSEHQKFFNNKSIPLSGGLFLCFFSLLIFFKMSFLTSIFFLIFLLGFLSDINILSSVKWRFFFQSIIIFFFIYSTNSNIESIRIYFIDIYLQNYFISCLFTSFCLILLINGTNFIDGLNGLVILYFLTILFILFRLNLLYLFFNDNFSLSILLVLLICLLFFNLSSKLYLGDSGSYLIGILIGYFLITVNLSDNSISPYFIALLLWYPAFEILFSIIRKLGLKKSPFKPDNYHFHHLLFFFIKKKFNLNANTCNNISSLIIIIYNFLIFNLSLFNIYYSYIHVGIIFLNIAIYLISYKKLYKFFIKEI